MLVVVALVGSTLTASPPPVSAEITRLGASTIVILGGTAAISTQVENDLKTLIGAS